MSLRYTGEATMDEPALRDVERWKDKIEVRLDNRQVFFLFFGSAMVACMLFVLGVIVGKRLESRGRAEAPAVEDPLAVLDRFGAVVTPAAAPAPLSFPRALIAGGPSGKGRSSTLERLERTERVEKQDRVERGAAAAERLAPERAVSKPTLTAAAPLPIAVPPAVAPSPPPAIAPKPVAATVTPARLPAVKLAAATAPTAGGAAGTAPALKKLSSLPRPLTTPATPSNRAAATVAPRESAPMAKLGSAPASKSAVGMGTVAGSGDKPKGRFLLQLSSFQDKGEADAFARRFAAQNAYVVATEIPGKGTWYRVRVGNYGSMQEAAAAKSNFERDHNVIAYVAGSGPAK